MPLAVSETSVAYFVRSPVAQAVGVPSRTELVVALAPTGIATLEIFLDPRKSVMVNVYVPAPSVQR
jgi:hypothetical protein